MKIYTGGFRKAVQGCEIHFPSVSVLQGLRKFCKLVKFCKACENFARLVRISQGCEIVFQLGAVVFKWP